MLTYVYIYIYRERERDTRTYHSIRILDSIIAYLIIDNIHMSYITHMSYMHHVESLSHITAHVIYYIYNAYIYV